MALTRSFLRGMNLTDEQVSAIIEAHTESTEALKEQRDSYKADAEAFKTAKKELDDLKAANAERNDDEWKDKYEAEHKAFEKFKTDQAEAKLQAEKAEAYKDLLKEVGIPENRINTILKVTDLANIEIKDGKLDNIDGIRDSVKEEWKDFIVSQSTNGTTTNNPPGNDGASVFKDMSLADKMQYANDHPTDPEVLEWLK